MRKIFILGESSIETPIIEKMLREHFNLPYAYASFKEGDSIKRADCFNCIVSPSGEELRIKHNFDYILVGCKKIESFFIPSSYPIIYRDIKFNPEEFLQFSLIGQFAEVVGLRSLTSIQLATAAAAYDLTSAYHGKCPGVTREDVLSVRIPFLIEKLKIKDETELREKLNIMVLYFALLKINSERIKEDFEIFGATILVEAKAIAGIE